jgi:hypothetical protein
VVVPIAGGTSLIPHHRFNFCFSPFLFRSQGTGHSHGWVQNDRVMQKTSHVMNGPGWRGRSCPGAAMSALCFSIHLIRPRTGSYGIFRNTFFTPHIRPNATVNISRSSKIVRFPRESRLNPPGRRFLCAPGVLWRPFPIAAFRMNHHPQSRSIKVNQAQEAFPKNWGRFVGLGSGGFWCTLVYRIVFCFQLCPPPLSGARPEMAPNRAKFRGRVLPHSAGRPVGVV